MVTRTETEPAGELQLVRTRTAWVDPAQGFLPLRIELRCSFALNGKPIGHPEHSQPEEVVDVTEVVEAKDGVFYPRGGTATYYCYDPRVQPNRRDMEALLAGAEPTPQVPYQVNSWEAYTVEAGRAMAPAMFIPRFPDDAAILDLTAKAAQKSESVKDPLVVGDDAPQWVVTSWTDGKQRQLGDLRGKVVLVDFWATWCGPCVNMMPAIESVHKQYDGRMTVVGIQTAGADLEKVRAMLTAKGIDYPSGIDTGLADGGVTLGKYGIAGLPTLILIDQNGRVAWTSQDARNVLWTKEAALRLGITWPPDKELSAEQLRRVHVALISEQVEKILKR